MSEKEKDLERQLKRELFLRLTDAHFGALMKTARVASGMTQEQLGQECRPFSYMTADMVYNRESGRVALSYRELLGVSHATGVSVDDLLGVERLYDVLDQIEAVRNGHYRE
ncbi:MAG: helix-turn-helix transcriptional regulator [Anaerolineae bacterium]|nr:helix-turn-helix transcriptional regulator [Anaerolineae bacterium]